MSSDPNPISRPMRVEDVAEGEASAFRIAAAPAECEALAKSLGSPAVRSFEAEGQMRRAPGGRLRVEGEIRADLTRICVVTLDPFEVEVREPFAIEFAPEAEVAAAAARALHEPAPGETLADLPDPPDPIVEGRIDLGAVAVEFLTLALDPYPRKPGANFAEPSGERLAADSPFAPLGRLKLDK